MRIRGWGGRGPTATASQAPGPPRPPAAVLGAEGQAVAGPGGPEACPAPGSSGLGTAEENRTFFFLVTWTGPVGVSPKWCPGGPAGGSPLGCSRWPPEDTVELKSGLAVGAVPGSVVSGPAWGTRAVPASAWAFQEGAEEFPSGWTTQPGAGGSTSVLGLRVGADTGVSGWGSWAGVDRVVSGWGSEASAVRAVSDSATETPGWASWAGVGALHSSVLGVVLSRSGPCSVAGTGVDRSRPGPGPAACSGAPAGSGPSSACPAPAACPAAPAERPFPWDPAGTRPSRGLGSESCGEPCWAGAEPAAPGRPPALAPAARLFFRLGLRGGAPGLPGDLGGAGLVPGDSGLRGGSPGGLAGGSRGAGPCRSLCISSLEVTGPRRDGLGPRGEVPGLRACGAADRADVLGIC